MDKHNSLTSIYFFINGLPVYRRHLYSNIFFLKDMKTFVYYGDLSRLGLQNDHELRARENCKFFRVKNVFLGNRLIYQTSVIRACLRKNIECAIFTGEINCISTWVAGLLLRLRGRRVVFWTHGIKDVTSHVKTLPKVFFYTIPNLNLVYSPRAQEIMSRYNLLTKKIAVFGNAINFFNNGNVKKISNRNCFRAAEKKLKILYVGRVTKRKKLELLFHAVDRLMSQGINCKVTVVGPLTYPVKSHYLENVTFAGENYDERAVSEYFATHDICISPGHVGLLAPLSVGYGVPVVTHRDISRHAPEASVLLDGYNAYLTDESVEGIVSAIKRFIVDKSVMERMEASSRFVRYQFSPEKKASEFFSLILRCGLNE